MKTIESQFGMPIERLRNFGSTLLEASVKGERYRKRKGGAAADELAQDEGGSERADLVEDGDGYLREERAEDG